MKSFRLQISPDKAILLSVAPEVHFPDPYADIMAAAISVRRGDRVLDMGCGAGGYGLSAAVRGAGEVVLTDVDPNAVTCALRNASRNGIEKLVDGRTGSLFAPVRGERFDIIVTSLPQLPAPEPILAARYGGPDGLKYLRKLAANAGKYLTATGRLYMLITDWAWPPRVERLFSRHGFTLRQLARIERPFQPAEYDAYAPGLFAYLDGRAQRGLAQYRRNCTWCYLGVSFFEATLDGLAHAGMKDGLAEPLALTLAAAMKERK